MSLDKLVDSTQLDSDLEDVANAIRAKSGGSSQLAFPADFVSAINAISAGGGFVKSTATFTNTTSERVVHHNANLRFGTDSFCMIVKPSAAALTTMNADTSTTYYVYCLVIFSKFFKDDTTATPRGTARKFDNEIYVSTSRGSVGNASAFLDCPSVANGTNANQIQYASGGTTNGTIFPNVQYEITILKGQVE